MTTTTTTTTTTSTTTATGARSALDQVESTLANHPLTMMGPDVSLSVREHISQASGQALEGLGDVLQKNEVGAPKGSVLREVKELSGFASSTTTV